MSKGHRLIVVAVGLVLILAAVGFFVMRNRAREADIAPPEASESTPVAAADGEAAKDDASTATEEYGFLKSTPETLESAQPGVDCAKPDAARALAGENNQVFYQADGSQDFIYFDESSRVLNVCSKGRAVAAVVKKEMGEGLEPQEEMVRVSDAGLGDMNGDGKPDFKLFYGQCVEGPCIGAHYFYQVEGDKLMKLYTLWADVVEPNTEGGARKAFTLRKFCYTYDFGTAFDYVAVAEVQGGELKLVPTAELKNRYPKVVDDLRGSGDLEGPMEAAYREIQDLVGSAYRGTPEAELIKSLDKIKEGVPKAGDQTDLGVHCDPAEILHLIANGR